MSGRSWTVLAEVSILVLLATGLLALGRVPVCTCGVVTLWSGDIFSNQNSQQLADPYSFSHLEHGLLLFWALRLLWPAGSLEARVVAATAFEAGWELFENTEMVIGRYRENTISLGYYGDSVINSMGDVAFCVAGFMLASRMSGRLAVVSGLALEAILAVLIRDGVILNVIMLIYPIDAIRRWQAGA